MNKLVFATNNAHKLDEVRAMLGGAMEVLSLKDIECYDDIPETAGTLEGNALQKAEYIYRKYGLDCFADDTGLEVDALDGAPGVYSARFAGEAHNSQKNMQKVLELLNGIEHREARFRTVIALIQQGETRYFEGTVEGRIAETPTGEAGFGYDPIFIPAGYDKSFAELGAEIKNRISHRGIAVGRLAGFLLGK